MKAISSSLSRLVVFFSVAAVGSSCGDTNPMPDGFKVVRIGMSQGELKAALGDRALKTAAPPNTSNTFVLEPAGGFKKAEFSFFSGDTLDLVKFAVPAESGNEKETFDALRAKAKKKFGSEGEFKNEPGQFFEFERDVRWVRCKEKVLYSLRHFRFNGGPEGIELVLWTANVNLGAFEKQCGVATETPSL